MEIDFESRRIYSKEQSFENMDCLNAYCLDENANLDPNIIRPKGLLDGMIFSIEYALTARFKEKQALKQLILSQNGVISYVLSRRCKFHLVDDREKAATSSKVAQAKKLGVPVVTKDYVFKCIEEEKLLDYVDYEIGGARDSFKSGKIQVSDVHNRSTNVLHERKRFKLSHGLKLSDVPVLDEDMFEEFRLIKWAGFKYFDKIKHTYLDVVVEIHQLQRNSAKIKSAGDSYRVVFYSDENNSRPRYRYLNSVDGTASIYSQICSEILQKSNCERLLTPPVGVGSKYLAELIVPSEEKDGEINPHVEHLIKTLWAEAVGEVENVLAVPFPSIRIKQIDEAESYVTEIKKLLQTKMDPIEKVVKVGVIRAKFSNALPLRNSSLNNELQSLRGVNHVLDLCQVLRDIVTVSESTFWQTRTPVLSMLRSLKCFIELVNPSDQIYNEILPKLIDRNIKIRNIFRVVRPVEYVQFNSDVGNIKLLFHGSKTMNAVGIMSRGLLLPNVATEDVGVARADVGNLGCGLYFSNSFSKSFQYTDPGKLSAERIMMICDVALGRIFETTKPRTDLIRPPADYQSVCGTNKNDRNNSFFECDEYVIYNLNQQRIRYLIEFSTNADTELVHPIDLPLKVLPDTENENEQEEVINIPKKQITNAGLVDKDGQKFPLKSLHVRAKLVDLAAEVVIFQKFSNPYDRSIEAKYVFPLDDNAAVCGFEAFIGCKHIIGRVEEKKQARKEYTEAVEKGHGAYLMEEEKPNIFTVSIGNLPSYCTVLIKITYVTEIQLDGDAFCFTLPSAVTPWDQKSALDEIEGLQTVTDSAVVDSLTPTESSLNISVNMPFEIKKIFCPTHPVKIKKTDTLGVVELCPNVSLNANFKLFVHIAEIHIPRMWVENHLTTDSVACMLVFYPEFDSDSEFRPSFDILLDMSNSMAGKPSASAKHASLTILDELNALPDGCYINVVKFGSAYEELFIEPKELKPNTFEDSKLFIQNCLANFGNTDIYNLLQSTCFKNPSTIRNIFILSDGHLNDERAIFDLIAKENFAENNCRLFTFGCSDTANSHLLKSLARQTGGCYEYLDPSLKSEWIDKIRRQIFRARQPCLTGVRVEWKVDNEKFVVRQAPRQIASLFSGERQIVYGFVKHCNQAILTAKVNGKEISAVVSASDVEKTKGEILHRLTTRAVIRDWEGGNLSENRIDSEINKRDAQSYIINLSKNYSVVSSLTSFVAVEEREKGESIQLEPDINELLSSATVDLLPYLCWQIDPSRKDKEYEEKIEHLLKDAEVQFQTSPLSSLDLLEKATKLIETLPLSHSLRFKVVDLEKQFEKNKRASRESSSSSEDEIEDKSSLLDEEDEEDPQYVRKCKKKMYEKSEKTEDKRRRNEDEAERLSSREEVERRRRNEEEAERLRRSREEEVESRRRNELERRRNEEEVERRIHKLSVLKKEKKAKKSSVALECRQLSPSSSVEKEWMEMFAPPDRPPTPPVGSGGRTKTTARMSTGGKAPLLDKRLYEEKDNSNLILSDLSMAALCPPEIEMTQEMIAQAEKELACAFATELPDEDADVGGFCGFQTEPIPTAVNAEQFKKASKSKKAAQKASLSFTSPLNTFSASLAETANLFGTAQAQIFGPPVFATGTANLFGATQAGSQVFGAGTTQQETSLFGIAPQRASIPITASASIRHDAAQRSDIFGVSNLVLQSQKATTGLFGTSSQPSTGFSFDIVKDQMDTGQGLLASNIPQHTTYVHSPQPQPLVHGFSAPPTGISFGFGSAASVQNFMSPHRTEGVSRLASPFHGQSLLKEALPASLPLPHVPKSHITMSSDTLSSQDPPRVTSDGSIKFSEAPKRRTKAAPVAASYSPTTPAPSYLSSYSATSPSYSPTSPSYYPTLSLNSTMAHVSPTRVKLMSRSRDIALESLESGITRDSLALPSNELKTEFDDLRCFYRHGDKDFDKSAHCIVDPGVQRTLKTRGRGGAGLGRGGAQRHRKIIDEVDEVHDLTDKFSNDTNFDSIDAFQADYVSLKIHVSKTLTLVNVESILDKIDELTLCDGVALSSNEYQRLVGIDTNDLVTSLHNAGLHSLGKTCYNEVTQMLAVLIAIIIFGLQNNCRFPFSTKGDSYEIKTNIVSMSDAKFVDEIFEQVTSLNVVAGSSMTQKFNDTRRRLNVICGKHPGVFYQLELAKNLQQFVGQLF